MNIIDPTVIIRDDVKIGKGNEILPYTVLIGPLEIGDNNYIGPHVTIGTPGQDTRNPRYNASKCLIKIGDNNIIREYTGIQKPCYGEITSIGNGCFLMQSVHVPHDAIIEDHVVITPMVVMGGLCRIMKGANLAISSSVHQYGVIGQYSIVGMGAAAVKNLRPFTRLIPGKPLSINRYAIEKYGFSDVSDQIEAYVKNQREPTDLRLQKILMEFRSAHVASGREVYI